jgi:hypothetical protein
MALLAGFTFSAPYMMNFGPQMDFLAWTAVISLFFVVAIPLLWIIQLLFYGLWSHRWSGWVSGSLLWIWVLACVFSLSTAVITAKDFSYDYTMDNTNIYPFNKEKMGIYSSDVKSDKTMWVHFGHWGCAQDENGWIIKNTEIGLEKSDDENIHVKTVIHSRGSHESNAKSYAASVKDFFEAKDDQFIISRYFEIPLTDRFRGQKVEYIFYIPEGITVELDKYSYRLLKDKSGFLIEEMKLDDKSMYHISL